MKLRLRIANNVDVSKTFSASLRGGARGYTDAVAVEAHSNDVAPCIKTVNTFTVIVEPNEQPISKNASDAGQGGADRR